MADTIRQRLVDAIDTRFKTILTTNGYKTNIGAHVFWWKESPMQIQDLPGMNCRDKSPAKELGCGVEDNILPIEIEATVSGSMTPTDLRKILADIETAIGVDETWGGLAEATDLKENDISADQKENKVGLVQLTMMIEYTLVRFDAYTLA
jgi:hypothetical protein